MPVRLDLFVSSRELFRALAGENAEENFNPFDSVAVGAGWRVHLIAPLSEDQAGHLLRDEQQRLEGKQMAFMAADYEALVPFSQAGWRTIFYNPDGLIAPVRLPLQDADIVSLDALDQTLSLLAKPSLQQCIAWWEAWDLPENIRQHSITVAWAAYTLAVLMRNQGVALDPMLAQRAGLVHDLDKIKTLKLGDAHGREGAAFLAQQGYPELAGIVREHIMHSVLTENPDTRGWEDRLVFFCDKLVEGDRIVSFKQRLAALMQRYPDYRETMARAEAQIWRLNDRICSILSIPDHEILISTLLKLQDY